MRSVAIAAVLAALLVPAVAVANGRAPVTNGVHFRPGDDHSVYVATTFGLLVSRDDGCTFHWICEDNIGYGGTFDPKYRIGADGAIFATTFSGLRISRDGGCSFTRATVDLPPTDPGRIADRWIDAIDIGPTGEIWVATADSGKSNDIYRSTDGGVTFAPRGMQSQTIWWKSLAVARSRPQRVYATGYQVAGTYADGGLMPPTAHVVITDDHGERWSESAMAGVAFGTTPTVYVVGVDRANADVVFLTSLGANPPSGDRLYRSTDGGVTWREVLSTGGTILELALGANGTAVVATLGGGAFHSTDGGATFAAMENPPQLGCVGQRDDGSLFGCAANWQPDFKAVARSSDGLRWNKVFRFVELAGPLECPADAAQTTMCAGQWPALQQQFGTTGPSTCNGEPTPDTTPPRRSGGCCQTGASGATESGELIALAALTGLSGAIVLRRRRRRA
jgi:hypothetical protein